MPLVTAQKIGGSNPSGITLRRALKGNFQGSLLFFVAAIEGCSDVLLFEGLEVAYPSVMEVLMAGVLYRFHIFFLCSE